MGLVAKIDSGLARLAPSIWHDMKANLKDLYNILAHLLGGTRLLKVLAYGAVGLGLLVIFAVSIGVLDYLLVLMVNQHLHEVIERLR